MEFNLEMPDSCVCFAQNEKAENFLHVLWMGLNCLPVTFLLYFVIENYGFPDSWSQLIKQIVDIKTNNNA